MNNKIIAAIDIGTNSFHLIIAIIRKDKSIKIIDRKRVVLRLASHEGENLSYINEAETNSAIDLLNDFKHLAENYHAEIYAVATSAVREAENKENFIESVYSSTGIKIKVIEGKKEAAFIFDGIKKAIPDVLNKKTLSFDIGGGSTEIIYSENGNILHAESVKIGAVRLSKKFFPDFLITDYRIDECRKYIKSELKSITYNNLPFDIAIGCSGTASSFGSIIYYSKHRRELLKLNKNEYSTVEFKEELKNILQKKTTNERLLIKGLESKKADIIPAGGLILDEIIDYFNIGSIILSEYALREGILMAAHDNLI